MQPNDAHQKIILKISEMTLKVDRFLKESSSKLIISKV